MDHLQATTPSAERSAQKAIAIENLFRTISEAKYILEQESQYGQPDIICQNAIQQAAHILGPDDTHFLDAREEYAQLLARIHRDDPRSAITEFRDILRFRNRLEGPGHPKTGKTSLRLARTMWAVDIHDVEVHDLIFPIISTHEILLETDQDFKMVTGVGASLQLQKRYEDAEQIFRAVLNQGKELSPLKGLRTLEARRRLAETLYHQAQSLKAERDNGTSNSAQPKIQEACDHAATNVSFLRNDGHRNAQDLKKNWDLLQRCQNELMEYPIPRPTTFAMNTRIPQWQTPQIIGGTSMQATVSSPPTYEPPQTSSDLSLHPADSLRVEAYVPRTKSTSALYQDPRSRAFLGEDGNSTPAPDLLGAGSQFAGLNTGLDTLERRERRSRMGLDQGIPNSQHLTAPDTVKRGPQSVSTESSGLQMLDNSGSKIGTTTLSAGAVQSVREATLTPPSTNPSLGRTRISDASAASESSSALHDIRNMGKRTRRGLTEFLSHLKGDNLTVDQGEAMPSSPSRLSRGSTEQVDAITNHQARSFPKQFSDSRASTIVSPTRDANGVEYTKPVKWILDLKESGWGVLENENAKARAADMWMNAEDRLQTTHKLLSKPPKPRIGEPVRVCVIDTGFDGLHPFLFARPFGRDWGKRVKGCISFDDQQKKVSESDWTQWSRDVRTNGNVAEFTGYRDDDGHGTHCAGLILEIAPQAELYIAKVGIGRNCDPNPDLIAQAIHHAADPDGWNVDIISMSFGFEPAIISIERAINAHSQKVVMFAAAANDGANSENIAFPARMDTVICIKAGNGEGGLSDFSQRNRLDAGDNFFTLGEEVLSMWPSKRLPNGYQVIQKRASGTSVATPVAAAIAALLLEFTRQADEVDAPNLLRQCAEDIAQSPRDRMKKIFRALSERNKTSSGRYVVPWIILNQNNGRRKAATRLHECLLPYAELSTRRSDLGGNPI